MENRNKMRENIMNVGKVENEIKLSSVINSQLKMINIDNREEIVTKILLVCELAGIETGESVRFEMLDDYYDTEIDYLDQNKFSLRKRSQTLPSQKEGEFYLTVKSSCFLKDVVGIARNEFNERYDNEAELDRTIANASKIAEIIMEKFDINLPIHGALIKRLTIKNSRTSIPIATAKADYTLYLDKYYFFVPRIADYSEYNYEIEIEKIDGLIGNDKQLADLHNALKTLFNYTDSEASKYKTALKWSRNSTETMPQVFVVMFDIVGYSLKPARWQKNNIQLLNRSLKQAIKSVFKTEKGFAYLPTGDGLILILDDYFKEVLPLCYVTQNIIKKENEFLTGDEKVEFRIGLNAGYVFKYSDINGSLNFAGDAINMVERVTNIGDTWHILATEEFHNRARDMNVSWFGSLYDIGEYTIKHGKKIRVYNIYNNNANAGNPSTPKKTD